MYSDLKPFFSSLHPRYPAEPPFHEPHLHLEAKPATLWPFGNPSGQRVTVKGNECLCFDKLKEEGS